MISIVVPSLNESASLQELVKRINEVPTFEDERLEIILVDDGSTDDSWSVISDLCSDPGNNCQAVRLRRNFGKAAALSAGIDVSSGSIIITMDADLQDEPSEIPRLLDKLDEGFDVVSGWKENRQDPWHKTMPSKVFNRLVNFATGLKLQDHNCGFKAYRREVFDEVRLYGEMHRFVPALAASRGFRVAELAVQHHPRKHGHSKYGVSRIVKGFLDLLTVFFLTGYGQRPQHLLGTAGLVTGGAGVAALSVLTLRWIFERLGGFENPIELHNRALFYYSILGMLLGVQLLGLGFLAEMFTQHASRSTPLYSIKESAGFSEQLHLTGTPPQRRAESA